MDRFLLAFAAFFIIMAAARWVHEAGFRHLSPEQKVALVDAQSGVRKYGLLIALPVVFSAFLFPAYAPWIVLVYVLVSLGRSYRRLNVSELPAAYRRAFFTYSVLQLAGVAVLFGILQLALRP